MHLHLQASADFTGARVRPAAGGACIRCCTLRAATLLRATACSLALDRATGTSMTSLTFHLPPLTCESSGSGHSMGRLHTHDAAASREAADSVAGHKLHLNWVTSPLRCTNHVLTCRRTQDVAAAGRYGCRRHLSRCCVRRASHRCCSGSPQTRAAAPPSPCPAAP